MNSAGKYIIIYISYISASIYVHIYTYINVYVYVYYFFCDIYIYIFILIYLYNYGTVAKPFAMSFAKSFENLPQSAKPRRRAAAAHGVNIHSCAGAMALLCDRLCERLCKRDCERNCERLCDQCVKK